MQLAAARTQSWGYGAEAVDRKSGVVDRRSTSGESGRRVWCRFSSQQIVASITADQIAPGEPASAGGVLRMIPIVPNPRYNPSMSKPVRKISRGQHLENQGCHLYEHWLVDNISLLYHRALPGLVSCFYDGSCQAGLLVLVRALHQGQ